MAEGDLGVAQLKVTADISQARASLDTLRVIVSRGFGDVGQSLFGGLDRQASAVGARVGAELSRSLTASLGSIDLSGLRRQLDFSGLFKGAFADASSNLQESLRTVSQLSSELQKLQKIQIRPSIQAPSLSVAPSASGQPSTSSSGLSEREIKEYYRQAQAVEFLQTRLERLSNTPIALNSSSIRKLGEEAVKASEGILDLSRKIINGTKNTASSIAGLRKQFIDYAELASNTSIGSPQFTTFTQAAAKTQQRETLSGGLAQIDALRRLYELPQKGILDSFKGTERLLSFNPGETTAGIKLYISALEQARSVTETSDRNFSRLTDEINRQRQALDSATKSTLELTRARQQLAEAGVSRREAKIQGIQDYYAGVNPRAGGVRDASGAMLARGSGDLAAEADFNRRTQERASVRQRVEQAQALQESLRNNGFGVQSANNFGLSDPIAKSIRRNQEKVAKEEAKRAEAAAAIERQRQIDLAIGQRNAEPIDGRLGKNRFAPGSPAAREALRERLTRAGGDALIGGAFPLLFGQGVGASAGGLIGGGLGGAAGGMFGFGLSLVGTAIGGAVDTLQKRFTDLAGALQDPIKNVETLTQQFILASKSQEDYIKALIATGQTARAAQVIQEQAARTLDPTTAASVASATDAYNRNLAQTQNILGSIVSGPAAGFLSFLNDVLRTVNGNRPIGSTRSTSPEAQRRANDELRFAGYSEVVGRLTFNPLVTFINQARVANARRNVDIAESRDVAGTEARLEASQKEQLRIQDAINRARQQGNSPLVQALDSTNKLANASEAYGRREREIVSSLAAGDINRIEALQQQTENRLTLFNTQNQITESAKNNQRVTAQQLADDRRRVEAQREILALTGSSSFAGKTGLVRANASAQILEQRLQLEAAQRNQATAQQAFNTASKNPANKAALDAAKADLATANNTAESARINTALAIRKIEVDTQVELRRLERERASEQLASVLRIADLRRQTTLERQRLNTDPLEFQRREALQPLQRANDAVRQARSDLKLDPQNEGLQRRLNEAINAQRLASAASSNRVADINEQIRQRGQRFGSDIAGLRDQQAIERARPQLGPLGLQTLQGAAQLRDTQRQAAAARQDLAARPADVGRQQAFQVASERLELASINFRNNLKEAFDDAVKRAGDVQRNLNLNVASLAEQDNSPANSINKFLRDAYGPRAADERQQTAFRELLPRFLATRSRLAESERSRGNTQTAENISNLNFRGSTESVNKAMIEFIRSAENQTQLQEQIIQGQKDLTKANTDLNKVIGALYNGGKLQETLGALADATYKLQGKDWNVYVNVPEPKR